MRKRTKSRRSMTFEAMENRELLAADLGINLASSTAGDREAKSTLAERSAHTAAADTEEVSFYYNKIAFGYAATTDGREF